jgi:hypothetical protein
MRKDVMKTGVTALAIALALDFAVAPTYSLITSAFAETKKNCLYPVQTLLARNTLGKRAARMPKCEI